MTKLDASQALFISTSHLNLCITFLSNKKHIHYTYLIHIKKVRHKEIIKHVIQITQAPVSMSLEAAYANKK